MPEYVDTHCHLDHHEQLRSAEQVERARAQGVTALVTVGTDLASSTEAVQTAARHDEVWATVGVHPNDTMEATPRVMECIQRLATQPRVVGIGESGLDYYRDWASPERQQWAFRRHIDLAKAVDKTLVIHCREAWDDTLGILEEEGPPERVVLHCFSGGADLAERCAADGYFLSFAGNVTFTNAPALREAAAATPLDRLLTETDSPFLTPDPHRGQPNEPAMVPLVAACLARVHGRDLEEVAAATVTNARRAFAL
ncbi:MAG: TatD family hydrolase [Actinomycetota bacterium]|nr:TatD family hydrolase [Actinomycetota bacterium]